MSIRNRLLLACLAPMALGIALLAGYNLWSFEEYFWERAREDLAAQTSAVRESVADALERGDEVRVELLTRRYGAQEGTRLRVIRPDGALLASSAPEDFRVPQWTAIPGVAEALQRRPSSGVARGLLARGDWLYQCQPIARRGRLLGVIRMSTTLEHFQRQRVNSMVAVGAVLVLTFGTCALLSAWLAQSLAAPIRTMRDFAVRIGSGHFGEEVAPKRPDELGELAVELNRMSARLASLDSERRAFLANVTHEFMTPVSNVQVTLEALQSGADDDAELRQRFVQNALDETGRLRRLIQTLLELGRIEAGVAPLQQRRIPLAELVRRCIRAVESRLRARGLEVRLDGAEVELRADPERLQQVLINLLDNAIKFSPPGSAIRVEIVPGAVVEIRIQDEGPGLSPGERLRVFEEFYVGDASRKGQGTGLGLAIARRIVEAHGGAISAANAPEGGAVFTVSLPLTGARLTARP